MIYVYVKYKITFNKTVSKLTIRKSCEIFENYRFKYCKDK